MKLKIKIGDIKKDMREIFEHPERAQVGTHTIYLSKPEELYELLSPKRLELIGFTLKNRKKTITDVASRLNRKQAAISRDAAILEKYRIVRKTKDKQKTYLVPNYDAFEITLGG